MIDEIELKATAYSKHFLPLLASQHRYIIAFGGRGAGKTEHFYMKYLLELFKPYYFRLAYVNKEFRHIRDNQYAGFKRVAKHIGIYDHLKFYDGDYRIENPDNGNSLIPRGMDDPEKTKGLDEVTAIWWDDITKSKSPSDFTTLNALLRTPKAKYLQFAISFNPVSKRHWARHFFFDEIDAFSLKKGFKEIGYLNHSTLYNNEFLKQQEYKDTLLLNSNNTQNSITVDINGEWGEQDLKNPFLYSFSSRHLSNLIVPIDEQSIVYLSFDFNISPCVCVIGQIINGTYKIIKVIGAESRQNNSSLQNLCIIINQYLGNLPKHLIRVTGDASGKHGSADRANSSSFFSTIREILVISDRQIITRKANITHNVSQEIINYFFSRLDITLYGGTEPLVDDIYIAFMDDKTSLNQAKKDFGLHFLDAMRYLVEFWGCYNNNNYITDISLIKRRINGLTRTVQ